MVDSRMADMTGTLRKEGEVVAEYFRLLASAEYRGRDLPRGDGRVVLVLPGLFGNDFYLTPLRTWLRKIGYRPEMSMLAVNAGCARRLFDQVTTRIERVLDRTQQPLVVVGHSRGGMLGKAIVSQLHAQGRPVSDFIALGSPVGGMLRIGAAGIAEATRAFNAGPARPTQSGPTLAAPGVMQVGQAVMRMLDPNCASPLCGCEYMDALLAPMPDSVQATSIYSSEDPIVPPSASQLMDADNHVVTGSHSGLVVNQAVFGILARTLARSAR